LLGSGSYSNPVVNFDKQHLDWNFVSEAFDSELPELHPAGLAYEAFSSP
jgi:hypothetical protein